MRAVIGRSGGRAVTWTPSVINGGGTSPGFSFASDGTKLVRTDICGAYKWDGSRWNQICDQLKLPYPAFHGYREIYGLSEIQVAEADTSVIYGFIHDGFANNQTRGTFIYKSTDGGASWRNIFELTKSTSADGNDVLFGANSIYKWNQNKLVIDPANVNVVYCCNPASRPIVTFDGGTTWTNVPDLPSAASGKQGAGCWQFDTTQGTTTVNGLTVSKYIYVSVEGSGIWRSTDGGVSFSQIVSMGANFLPNYTSMSSDGVYYITYSTGTSGNVGRYQSGTWTPSLLTVSSSSTGAGRTWNVAAHPTSAGVVVMLTNATSPQIYQSTNYGTTLTSINKTSITISSTDSPWYANQLNGAFAMQQNMSCFDPANPDDYWASWGQGLCKTTLSGSPPQISATPTFTAVNNGMENAVCDCLVHESGTKLLQVMADINGFVKDTTTSALATSPSALLNPGGATNSTAFIRGSGWQGAIDPFVKTNMVIMADRNFPGNFMCGYSTDGGSTWASFPTVPPGISGQIITPAMFSASSCSISGSSLTIGGTTSGNNPSVGRYVFGTGVAAGTTISSGTYPNFTVSPGGQTVGPIAMQFATLGAVVPLSIMISNGVILCQSYPSYGWYRSADWGATWTRVTINTPVGATYSNGWGNVYSSIPGKTGEVDRVNSSKMYLYNWNYGATPTQKGFYVSTDAGVSFDYQGSTSDPLSTSGQSILHVKAHPSIEGYLFCSTGYISTSGAQHPQTSQARFWYSTDSAATWTQIPNMYEIVFGFGAVGPRGHPTLYAAGFNRQDYGVWMSDDLGTTWWQMTSTASLTWPRWNDSVQWVEGDKDVYGRCYVGFQGSGAIYSTLG